MNSAFRNCLVDSHVHIHPSWDVGYFLDSAHLNFKKEAQRRGWKDGFLGVLCLAEMAPVNRFNQLANMTTVNNGNSSWTITKSKENRTLWCETKEGNRLLVLAGRQFISSEKLEVLALGTCQTLPDGAPMQEILAWILAEDALPVLPWGVGKWLGRRGETLNALLKAHAFPSLWLGDNSGRPVFWHSPSHFKRAHARGIPILPGTDPLHLKSERTKAGSFGFGIDTELGDDQPGSDLLRRLRDPSFRIQPYGKLESPIRFFKNQIDIRLSKKATETT